MAVLYQGPESGEWRERGEGSSCGPSAGIAPEVERQTILCQGKLCKAGKSGLAKSSSSFQVTDISRQTLITYTLIHHQRCLIC